MPSPFKLGKALRTLFEDIFNKYEIVEESGIISLKRPRTGQIIELPYWKQIALWTAKYKKGDVLKRDQLEKAYYDYNKKLEQDIKDSYR